MNPDQRVQYLEVTLTRQLAWIAGADAKVGTFFALDMAMLGVLAALLPSKGSWTLLAAIAAPITGALLLWGLVCLAIAIFPRTSGPKQSLVFFGGIAGRESDQYCSDMLGLTHENYRDDLARQVHRNACIATEKYRWVRHSAQSLFAAILPWLVALMEFYRIRTGAA